MMIDKYSMTVSVAIMNKTGDIEIQKHTRVFAVDVKGEYVVIQLYDGGRERKITLKAQDVIEMEVRNHGLY